MEKTKIQETIFKVHDVEKNTDLFKTQNVGEVIDKTFGKVVASSIKSKEFISIYDPDFQYNDFLGMMCMAYNGHKPIIISPDNIWLLICQGLSEHIKKHSWLFRLKLVNFLWGKKVIRNENHVVEDAESADWEAIIEDISKQTATHLKDNLYSKMILNFSTTTQVEKTAFEITFMDAVSKYFYYEVTGMCGYPEIKLT